MSQTLPEPRQTRYGILRCAPFSGASEPPAQTEVVIIGGGICGVTTAYYLAKRGVPVVLCEKAEIGCEASSRAFGWISELLLDPVKMPMSVESKRLWEELHAEVGETGFRRGGLAFMAESEGELEFYDGWLKSVEGLSSGDNVILTSAQVAERYPGAARKFAGAVFSRSDGSAEPFIASSVIAEAARRAGAVIVTDCAVRGLDLQGGRIAGVFTEKGHIRAKSVLCAANAWSRLFCGNHGVDIPQVHVVMTQGRSTVTAGPVGAGAANGAGWRRQIDGTYALGGTFGFRAPVTIDAIAQYSRYKALMKSPIGAAALDWGRAALDDLFTPRRWNSDGVSPFEKRRVLSPSPHAGYSEKSLALNAEVFPEMAPASVKDTYAGIVPMTPDNAPIAGPVDKLPGFYVVTGASYGISWAPSLGKLLADMMTGAAPSFDPAPYRLSRFFDGSPIIPLH